MDRIIGYTTGVFDLFHIGHLNVLKAARSKCDYLIVGVTSDELCATIKSKLPVVPYKERAEIVEAIKFVDQVVPQNEINELKDWESLRFHKIFKGGDWQGTEKWNRLELAFAERSVLVEYFPYTESTSSTLLKNTLLATVSEIFK